MYSSKSTARIAVFANDLDAFVPELWAQESLRILENEMVITNLVHRDFEPIVAQYGDVVNTRKPGTFEGKRKGLTDDVTMQDADSTNVAVPLDQHFHVSFMIRDGEQSKGFVNLVSEYLYPAVLGLATSIDQVLLSQVYRFRATSVGMLGTAPTKATVIAARVAMNDNKVPSKGRSMIVTSGVEGDLLNIDAFVNAEKVGDDGTALREGSLGRKFGMDFFMCQQTPSVATGSTVDVTLTLSGNEAIGQTVLSVSDDPTAIALDGNYITIAGDMTPQRVTASTSASSASTITVTPGLKTACVSGAAITVYTDGHVGVDQAVSPTGYVSGWPKTIVTATTTVAPKRGQLVSFGTATSEYATINTPTTEAMLMDIPLAAGIADNVDFNLGPAGDYCFGFHKNALAFVNRPLALPESGTGAKAAVVNFNGLSIRVCISYDSVKQGQRVTVDCLAGVKVLDTSLGVCMYG